MLELHFTIFDEIFAFSFEVFWDANASSQLPSNVADGPVQVSMNGAGRKAT